ncbi:MAG: mRNA interferase YafQ [Patescibacteria group bacterium]|jgi:addiction module RelE/StbE family toxin|nr:mRNA interferase YafQ [Patescibacteria group bacterium]
MQLFRSKRFEKQFAKLSSKAKEKATERLLIFVVNPFDSILQNHSLTGVFLGCRSISITGDIRAIYLEVDRDTAHFLLIGTHHELYGK